MITTEVENLHALSDLTSVDVFDLLDFIGSQLQDREIVKTLQFL